MGILGAKGKKKFFHGYVKNISKRIPGSRSKVPESLKKKIEDARAAGLKHRVPGMALEEFMKSVEMIDQGESLEKVITRLKERGIHDPKMFQALAKRAEEREKRA